jgi:hypothetical protein
MFFIETCEVRFLDGKYKKTILTKKYLNTKTHS